MNHITKQFMNDLTGVYCSNFRCGIHVKRVTGPEIVLTNGCKKSALIIEQTRLLPVQEQN